LGAALWVAAVFACGGADYGTPASTLRTYQDAVRSNDPQASWACFSRGYQAQAPGGYLAWQKDWGQRPAAARELEGGRTVALERVINEKVAFILLQTENLPPRPGGPFVYFVREADGWKMTSHMDTTFHHELETAIARGEFRLPPP
jgi:hypothetical protein